MVWGSQHLGPMVLRALRSGDTADRHAERERQAALEAQAEERRNRAVASFLEEHPEYEAQFRADMLAGVEPGLLPSQRLAMFAVAADAEDRRETRQRSERLRARRAGQVPPEPRYTHQEILARAAAQMDWEDGIDPVDLGPVAS